jgi:hypothetical protein
MVTPHDIERYMNAYRAQQGTDAMHEDLHRWIRQIRARGQAGAPAMLAAPGAQAT